MGLLVNQRSPSVPVEATDYDRFDFLFEQYMKLTEITSNMPSHLLDCITVKS